MPDDRFNPLAEVGHAAKDGVGDEALRLGYEPSKLDVRGLGLFLLYLCIAAIVIHVGVWVLLKHYASLTDGRTAPMSAVRAESHGVEPALQPSPQHDTTPPQDLAHMRAGENEVFARMGWHMDKGAHDPTIPPEIVASMVGRTAHPSTAPATNAYENPYKTLDDGRRP